MQSQQQAWAEDSALNNAVIMSHTLSSVTEFEVQQQQPLQFGLQIEQDPQLFSSISEYSAIVAPEEFQQPAPFKFDRFKDQHVRLSGLTKNNNIRLNEVAPQYVFVKGYGILNQLENTCSGWRGTPDKILIGRMPSNIPMGDQSKAQTAQSCNYWIYLFRCTDKYDRHVDVDLHRDKGVSHNHCAIYLGNAWEMNKNSKPMNYIRKITPEFLQFLKLRKIDASPWKSVPHELFAIVWSFARTRKQVLIQDLGSRYGTFVKIRSETTIRSGLIFKLDLTTLIKCIRIEQACIEPRNLQAIINSWTKDKDVRVIDKYQANNLSRCTGLVIEVEELNSNNTKPFRYLLLTNTTNTYFVIGRAHDCDIILNKSNISRRHCTIIYQNGWRLRDGDSNGVASVNGVWADLRTVEDINQNRTSQPKTLNHMDEINIGETYFRIEILNTS